MAGLGRGVQSGALLRSRDARFNHRDVAKRICTSSPLAASHPHVRLATMTMRIEATVSILQCAGCGHQTPHLTFSADTDMVMLGLASLSSVVTSEIVVVERTPSEIDANSSKKIEIRVNALLGRTDLRMLQVRRIVKLPLPAGKSFQDFRRSYRPPHLAFACPHCEMDAIAIRSMTPSAYRQHGGQLTIMPDVDVCD